MTRRERVVTVAAQLAEARATVTRLEAELDDLLGATEARPAAAPRETANGTNGHGNRGRGVETEKILALAKAGKKAAEIVEAMGYKDRVGVIKVRNAISKARLRGILPKAGAAQ